MFRFSILTLMILTLVAALVIMSYIRKRQENDYRGSYDSDAFSEVMRNNFDIGSNRSDIEAILGPQNINITQDEFDAMMLHGKFEFGYQDNDSFVAYKLVDGDSNDSEQERCVLQYRNGKLVGLHHYYTSEPHFLEINTGQ